MPRSLKKPTDKQSSQDIMKKFSEMAYAIPYKEYFEEAVYMLYGEEFIMKKDLTQRMVFFCKLCSKDMNSEVALAQHSRSGSHQKNLDRKIRENKSPSCIPDTKNHYKDEPYDNSSSLQYMLETSPVKPIGLQMIEQYEKKPGSWSYYKCNLCAAHGKLDAIYKHIIGNRHTEKYIKTRVVLKNSILTVKEREFIRDFLIKKEGISKSSIKVYRDRTLYPIRWEKHIPTPGGSQKKRQAQRGSPSTSQSPSTSRPSCSSSPDRSSEGYPLNEYSQKRPRETSSQLFQIQTKEFSQKKSRVKSPLSMFRNKSPPPGDKAKTAAGQKIWRPLQSKEAVTTKDQSTQKYDLEELMVQFNFIVKTSHLPEFDICTPEDAKAALDMMFKITSALHFITKSTIENSKDNSKEYIEMLTYKKSLLSKIMGSIKLRMEAALVGNHGMRSW